jgi:hypothetical protein
MMKPNKKRGLVSVATLAFISTNLLAWRTHEEKDLPLEIKRRLPKRRLT